MSVNKASEIILNKLIESGPVVTVYTLQGKPCKCTYSADKKYFICDKLHFNRFDFSIFDLTVSAIEDHDGKIRKGNARNSKLGEGKCTYDTLAGILGRDYFSKNTGESVYDPVFVLAAVLEWAGLCDNTRGYLSLR